MAVPGYPHLASHISACPSSLITRSFSSLAARNILYLQAELVHLEMKLCELEKRDSQSAAGKKAMYSRDWYWLHSAVGEEEKEQWETILQIRKKLEEYHHAVLQQAAISDLPRPLVSNLRTLQDWLERPGLGDMALVGEDRKVWGYTNGFTNPASDLTAFINRNSSRDPFSNWITYQAVRWVYRQIWQRIRKGRKPRDEETGLLMYEEELVMRWTGWISAAVASSLPLASVITLYFVRETGLRLGFVVLFTFLFAAALMAFTTARSVDVFAATAAFAAVEVVFVSGNISIT